jgi:hypothetical protein
MEFNSGFKGLNCFLPRLFQLAARYGAAVWPLHGGLCLQRDFSTDGTQLPRTSL